MKIVYIRVQPLTQNLDVTFLIKAQDTLYACLHGKFFTLESVGLKSD